MKLLLLILLATGVVPALQTEPPIVDTTSGRIAGAYARWRPNVWLYSGIPYAQPPVGDLRWRKPVRYSRSPRVIQATKPPHMCVQFPWPVTPDNNKEDHGELNRALNFELEISGMRNSTESEDCLYLNVWNKPGGSQKKAVMVWIYGGAFLWGSAQGGVYDGSVLADENDVIVVGINYRLGAFGFAKGPGIDTNVGLRDQRMALEWIRDNVENFGGDPERITVFGQSAGAISIDLYTHVYKHDPIIKGAILMSGSVHLIEPVRMTPMMGETRGYYAFSKSMGCGGREAGQTKTLACLRRVPASTINSFRWSAATFDTIGFSPYIDHELIFSEYISREAAGAFANVSYLIGSTEHELRNTVRFMQLDQPAGSEVVETAPITLFTLFFFTCGAAMSAAARSAHNVPVWMYQYAGNFTNTYFKPFGGNYHMSDIPQVFGTAGYTTLIPNTPEEDKYSAWTRGVWTDFAKDPRNGLSKAPYNWPKFSNKTDSLLRLGVNNTAAAVKTNPSYACALCPFIECAQFLAYRNILPLIHHHTKLNRILEADILKRAFPSKLLSSGKFKLSPDKLKLSPAMFKLSPELLFSSPELLRLMPVPPSIQVFAEPLAAYSKALRNQLISFTRVAPGEQAKAEPVFAQCKSTFPVGPIPLPAG